MAHKRIVLIDDEKALRESIADFLRIKGNIVFEASNGAQGLKVIEHNKPQVVICDILMPEMDGFEVLQNASKLIDRSNITWIVLTALNDEDTKEKCLSLGAQHFITKPFRINDLLEIL